MFHALCFFTALFTQDETRASMPRMEPRALAYSYSNRGVLVSGLEEVERGSRWWVEEGGWRKTKEEGKREDG